MRPTTPSECVPDIEIKEVFKPLDAELLLNYPCPRLPTDGSNNKALTDWSESCAAASQMCNINITKIRDSQP